MEDKTQNKQQMLQQKEQQIQQQHQQEEQYNQSMETKSLLEENISSGLSATITENETLTDMWIQEEGYVEQVGAPQQPEVNVEEEEQLDYQQNYAQYQQQQRHHSQHNNNTYVHSHRQYNPKKSVSFKTLVDIFQLSDAWQLHVKKSSLKTEEDQAKRRILQRNY